MFRFLCPLGVLGYVIRRAIQWSTVPCLRPVQTAGQSRSVVLATFPVTVKILSCFLERLEHPPITTALSDGRVFFFFFEDEDMIKGFLKSTRLALSLDYLS